MAKFGAYEILHELKSGGMGAVLLGRRRGPGSFEQLVAIKTIRPEYASALAVRAMFLDEAAILARINHPGIATVHDFGEENGTLYMVMEYVAGISFRALADVRMPPGVAARAIAEACRGVHAAHEVRDTAGALLGVVHRDISPDNLMLGYDGHVKVIDFGIALVKNRQSPVTEFGTVKGKPPYMSPEQVKNEAIDRRSDVFSLAVVLHELLTGDALFDGDSIYAIARAVEHQDIVPPSRVTGAALPAGLDAAVMAALERDLTRRTPSAAALAEALEQVISSAGDETLEAWADRELAQPRAAHRQWLASVVSGHDTPAPIGRATNSVTALGPLAAVMSLPQEVIEPPPPVEVRRRRVIPVVLAVVLLAGITAGVLYLLRTPEQPVLQVLPPDAASVVVVVVERDAAPDAIAISIDAALEPPIDARARHVSIDAPARVVVDAAVPRPDAPVAVAGTGKLTVRHHPDSPSFLEVRIDGVTIGHTPIYVAKPIGAGPHVLTLVKPGTGEVVFRKDIVIVDGETLAIQQPTPHQ
ncbi:MAG: serine/threonine-protein kinase [Kofleriaceae bacterium]